MTYIYKTKKDLKVASGKEVSDYILNKYASKKLRTAYNFIQSFYGVAHPDAYLGRPDTPDDDRQFLTEVRNAYKEALPKVDQFLNNSLYKDESISSKVIKEFTNRGYDAIVDVEDSVTGLFDCPMILLNPKDSIKFKNSHSAVYDLSD